MVGPAVAAVARAAAARAAARGVAAGAAGAGARGAAAGVAGNAVGTFGAGNIGKTVGQKFLEYGFVIPGLQGLRLIPGAHPAAAPPAPGVVSANLRYANPQAAWWDQLLFKGKINKMFGPPQGFEYTKLDKETETKRRGQDLTLQGVRERVGGQIKVADINQQGRVKSAEIAANARRFDSVNRLQGIQDTNATKETIAGKQYNIGGSVDRVSGRQLEGVKYRADQGLTGTQYTADRRLQGTQYTADRRLQGQDLTSGRQLEGTKYKADRTVDVAGITAAGRVKVAQVGLEGTKYKADRTVDVANINTAGRIKVADLTSGRRLEGTKYAADRNYQGRVESANITGGYNLAREGVRQTGQVQVAQIRGDAAARVADTTGMYRVAAADVGGRRRAEGQIGAAQAIGDARIAAEQERTRAKTLSEAYKLAGAGLRFR